MSFTAFEDIYLMATDRTIDTSSFFYAAESTGMDSFRIYFNRKNVIGFCDSALKSYSHEPQSVEAYPYKSILNKASKNKNNNIEYDDERKILFGRFSPLVINTAINDTPHYIIVVKTTVNGSQYKTYYATSNNKDTVMLNPPR